MRLVSVDASSAAILAYSAAEPPACGSKRLRCRSKCAGVFSSEVGTWGSGGGVGGKRRRRLGVGRRAMVEGTVEEVQKKSKEKASKRKAPHRTPCPRFVAVLHNNPRHRRTRRTEGRGRAAAKGAMQRKGLASRRPVEKATLYKARCLFLQVQNNHWDCNVTFFSCSTHTHTHTHAHTHIRRGFSGAPATHLLCAAGRRALVARAVGRRAAAADLHRGKVRAGRGGLGRGGAAVGEKVHVVAERLQCVCECV